MVAPPPDFRPGAVCHGHLTAQQSKDRCARATSNEVANLLASREFEVWLDRKRSSTALAWRVASILALLLAASSATSVRFYGQLMHVKEDSSKLLQQLSAVSTPKPDSGAAVDDDGRLLEVSDQSAQEDVKKPDDQCGPGGLDGEPDAAKANTLDQQLPRDDTSADGGVDHRLIADTLLADVQLKDDRIAALEAQVKETERNVATFQHWIQTYKGIALWGTCVIVVIAASAAASYGRQRQKLNDIKEELRLEKRKAQNNGAITKDCKSSTDREEQIAELQEENRAIEMMSKRMEMEVQKNKALKEKVTAVAKENEELEQKIEPFKGLLRTNAEMKEQVRKLADLQKENQELRQVAGHLAAAQEENRNLKALKQKLDQVKEQNSILDKTTLQLPPEERRVENLREKIARLDELKKERELLEPKAQSLDSVEKEHKQLLATANRVAELQEELKRLPALQQEEMQLREECREVDNVVAKIVEITGKAEIVEVVTNSYNIAKRDADSVDRMLLELGSKHEDVAKKVKRVQELQSKLTELEDEGNKLAKTQKELQEKMAGLQVVQKDVEILRADLQGLAALEEEKKELQAKAKEMEDLNKDVKQLSEVVKNLELMKERHTQLKRQAAEVEALQAENAKLEEAVSVGDQAMDEKNDANHSAFSKDGCTEESTLSPMESESPRTERGQGGNATSQDVGNVQQHEALPSKGKSEDAAVDEPSQLPPNGDCLDSSADLNSTTTTRDGALGPGHVPDEPSAVPARSAAEADVHQLSFETNVNT